MRPPRGVPVAIVVLAAIGVVVAGYGLWQHYAPVGSAICNISERLSCDIVNKSPWSEVFGIPVAGIGLLGYLAMGALALMALGRVRPIVARPSPAVLLLVLALGGLAVQGFLTYIEFFVIGVACPICVVSQALILAITVLALIACRGSARAVGALVCPSCSAKQDAGTP